MCFYILLLFMTFNLFLNYFSSQKVLIYTFVVLISLVSQIYISIVFSFHSENMHGTKITMFAVLLILNPSQNHVRLTTKFSSESC